MARLSIEIEARLAQDSSTNRSIIARDRPPKQRFLHVGSLTCNICRSDTSRSLNYGSSSVRQAQIRRSGGPSLLPKHLYPEPERLEVSRVCFALYLSGRYQLLKVATVKTEVLQGTLSQDELNSISRMLSNLDPEKSNKGVMIEKSSESFVALLMRETARRVILQDRSRR